MLETVKWNRDLKMARKQVTMMWLLWFWIVQSIAGALWVSASSIGTMTTQDDPIEPSCGSHNNNNNNNNNGSHWVRPIPSDPGTTIDSEHETGNFDVGVLGMSVATARLAQRMYVAIESAYQEAFETSAPDLSFRIHAMDLTAREAVRAVLTLEGLEMILAEDKQGKGEWGVVESIQLIDDETGKPLTELYETWEEAADQWTPGQGFDFVAKQVPAVVRDFTVADIMPNIEDFSSAPKAIRSILELASEFSRRKDLPSWEAQDEDTVYTGDEQKLGYLPIGIKNLIPESMNDDGTENASTKSHVLDAITKHGCLLVDLTDGGRSFDNAKIMTKMWKAVDKFFLSGDTDFAKLPKKKLVRESGTRHATIGYKVREGGNIKSMNMRLSRTGELLPEETLPYFGEDAAEVLPASLNMIVDVGKNLVRIITSASIVETGRLNETEASQAAQLMANEIIDDNQPLTNTSIDCAHTTVSNTNYRPSVYNNFMDEIGEDSKEVEEVFGAHTDATFITAIPVSAVSGIEVFDEYAGQWYRPELFARRLWQTERKVHGLDPEALEEEVDGEMILWNARYVLFMPGELLELVSRQKVVATVHRVVAAHKGPNRLSVPVLMRYRSGTRMNVERYLGGFGKLNDDGEDELDADAVLRDVDGMTMNEIHTAIEHSI